MKKAIGSNVKVTADLAGNVVIKSSNPEFGNIRVEQTRVVTDNSGFLKPKKLSALIPGDMETLNSLGWENGDEIEGKIIVKESTEPFNKKDPEKDLKVAGDSGVVCSIGGKPIYRKNFYSIDETVKDELVIHDNTQEIQAAYAAMKEAAYAVINEEVNTLITTEPNFDL